MTYKMTNRIESLDWLRGLMALSIMLYHFGTQHDASAPLGRLGVYGVSIFFILSGLSMAIVYDQYIRDLSSSVRFFVRRLFRIWPLLWIAVGLVVLPADLLGTQVTGHDHYGMAFIVLNLTTLFGFVAPSLYINVGAWSIGNEMVYYALTPLFIAAYHWRRGLGNALTGLATAIGLWFAYFLLEAASPLAVQWGTYINPFNNLFLYCAGMAIYYNCTTVTVPQKWHWPILSAVGLAFFFYPVSGDQIHLVTGSNRVAMSIISICVVFAFYKCAPTLPQRFARGLERLGIATYGVYLLHPIVRDITHIAFQTLGIQVKGIPTLTAIGMTIVLASLTYRFVEAPLIALGKRLTRRAPPRAGDVHLAS